MAAAGCPAGRAGPGAFGRCAGLQFVRGGCELALTSESAAAARACPLGAPGLPREGGGERRETAEAASRRLEARAAEATAAGPPGLPGPAPTNSSCASGQTMDLGVPPAQAMPMPDPRGAAVLGAPRRGRGTQGATPLMGCPSGWGRWPQTPRESARRLAALALAPTAAPPRWSAWLHAAHAQRSHSRRRRKPRRAPAKLFGKPGSPPPAWLRALWHASLIAGGPGDTAE